jgi:hypothetical protein
MGIYLGANELNTGGSAGGGAFLTSPLELPRTSLNLSYLGWKYGSQSIHATSANGFWDLYDNHYAYANLTTNTNYGDYVTIVDINNTNGGLLHHVISGAGGSMNTNVLNIGIKITMDGTVYEIDDIDTFVQNAGVQVRAVLGYLSPARAQTATATTNQVVGSYYNFLQNANAAMTKGFDSSYSYFYATVPSPEEQMLFPSVKFNQTLKVETRARWNTSGLGHYSGVGYKLF